MADPQKKVSDNQQGAVFVDTTCIDCDTCRQLAPEVFSDNGQFSFVSHQPHGSQQWRAAMQALLACPTGSIGIDRDYAEDGLGKLSPQAVMSDFPMQLEQDVYYCGFNSPKSFGGNSYFIKHPDGNWLVDSPKFLPHLVSYFGQQGGLKYIFLTHEDDVADAKQYAARFDAKRIIHQGDRDAQPDAELQIEGETTVEIGKDFLIIPTPGHTAGHCVLLYQNRFLFTGDHLWGNSDGTLGASSRYNWHSWPKQLESMEKLLNYSFEWVLPGHGRRLHLPEQEMRRALKDLLSRAATRK